ncbi:MAG: ATP-binding protein [Oscillochloridaceae bacterium umkhey_bin13]
MNDSFSALNKFTSTNRAMLLAEAEAARAAGDLPTAAFSYAAAIRTFAAEPDAEELYELHLARAICLHGAGDYHAEHAELDQLETLANELDDPARRVRVALRRAALQILFGNAASAEQVTADALKLAQTLSNLGLMAEAIYTRCEAVYSLGDLVTAQRHAQAALASYQLVANQRGEAYARRVLGLTLVQQGQHREGIGHLYRSLDLCRVNGDQAGEALALNAIGISTDDRAVARAVFQQGLAIAEQIGDRESEALLSNNLGIVYVSLGLYVQARTYSVRAVRLARLLGARDLLAAFLKTLGRAYGGAGRFELARQALDEALALAEQLGNRESIAITLICMGRADLAEGLPAAALQHFERAVTLCDELASPANLATALAWLAVTKSQAGDHEQALATSARAVELAATVVVSGEFPLQEVWWLRYTILSQASAMLAGHSCVAPLTFEATADPPTPELQARVALRQARDVMYAAIINLSDPGLRRSYLGRVAINRTIIETLADLGELGQPPIAVSSYASVEDRLTRMLGVTARLNELHHAETLREMFLDEVVELSGAERVILVLGNHLEQPAQVLGRGFEASELEAYRLQSLPLLQKAVRRRQGVLLHPDHVASYDQPPNLETNSVVVVPLISGSHLVGVMLAEVRSFFGPFGRGDLDLLGILAAQAATALENTRLYLQALEAKQALEHEVAARTADLQTANHALVARAAEALAAHSAAEAASAAKSAFLANVSHELRTPLNAVIGFAQILQHDQQLGPRQRELAQIIARSSDHLLGLINDVLELTKIEAGRLAITLAPFDLHRLLSDLDGLFRLRAETRQISFTITLDPALPRAVIGDEGRLRQVLINLLSNAFKFTVSGAIRVYARPEPGTTPLRIQIAVADTGAGIAPSELTELFQPFMQTASGREAKEGTGLGLALSRQLARLMGGDILVTSEPGRGSTFTVLVALDPAEPSGLAAPEVKVLGLATAGRRYRILLAMSDPQERRLRGEWLRSAGLEVREAADGAQALAFWAEWRPHLLLSDATLMVISGNELTRRIKALPAGRATLVVLLGDNQDELGRTTGCDAVLPLNANHDQLLVLIAEQLGLDLRLVEDLPEPIAPLSPTDLADLPAALRDELARATAISDPAMVEAAIAQISATHPELGTRLSMLAAEFQFDRLEQLLAE